MSGPHYLRVIFLVLAVTAGLGGGLLAVPAQGATNGVIYMVQGLPGRTLDIQVDGRAVASGVKATGVVGPLTVASGQRRITAREGGRVVIERQVTVGAGGNLDVVIHRPAAPTAAPVITSYANKLTPIPKDKAALRVAHTAAVGPADIRVNGQVVFQNVANGESLDVVVPAGTYSVDIVPTGATSPVVLGPVALTARAGYLTRVFAVGEPNSKTMNVAVGTIKLAATGTGKPGKVDTGTGGQAAGLSEDRPSLVPLGLLLGCALLLTVRKLATVRRVVRR
ncbi:uncharacterized protein DUF4397 [Kribbella sp. VKM Ac-2527]|uniref:Uncharacterized protein DUF4397 n=1 Tax=Kribbella caucasensis TaxID=2512215 RepID=A0A4R6KKP8_9ACTN|nr:uncharacterized protein DUF4397 [Kribbella sp. VKM Ac-2527]